MYIEHRYRKRTSAKNYIIPFLIIICVGVIVVLLFNLVRAMFSDESKYNAYMHIVEGNISLRSWGTEDFINLSSDALIIQGDEIKTSKDAKIIVEFFDGTLMRVSGGSDIVFNEIFKNGEIPQIEILLVSGKVWFNKIYKQAANSEIIIKMDNLAVNSNLLSIFDIENEFDEIVRVLGGEDINVDIYNKDDDKIVETENVGVGQEADFNDAVLKSYWDYKSPTVVMALSDEFKATSWYTWNGAEDKTPTEFIKVIGGNGGEFVKVPPVANGDAAGVAGVTGVEPPATGTDITPQSAQPAAALSKPTISSVSGITETNADGFYVVTSNVASLTGSVSGAAFVMVNTYTLQKFKAGDSSWTYFANADYGLMKPGENNYEVYAVSADGTKSEALVVKVLYNPPAPTPAPAPAVETPPATSAEITPADNEISPEVPL